MAGRGSVPSLRRKAGEIWTIDKGRRDLTRVFGAPSDRVSGVRKDDRGNQEYLQGEVVGLRRPLRVGDGCILHVVRGALRSVDFAANSCRFGVAPLHQSTPSGRYDRQVTESDVYDVIGETGFTRLVSAFYAQVPGDDILGPMYHHGDLAGAEERLRDFLVFRFGGPARYIERRGHPRLRARHAPFRVDRAARDRWVLLMERALDETALAPEADGVLRGFFRETADFLINRPAQ